MKSLNKRPFAGTLTLGAFFVAAAMGLPACEEQGPLEEAGEEVDDAMDDAADSVEDAVDDAADKIDDATDGG